MKVLDYIAHGLSPTTPIKVTPEGIGAHVAALSGIAVSYIHAIPTIMATAASTGAFLFYVISGWIMFKNRNK